MASLKNKFIISFLFLTFFTSESFSQGLYAEDGSMPMHVWYHGENLDRHVIDGNLFKQHLEREGVSLKSLNYPYDWVQDLSLFAADGSFLLMAPFEFDEDYCYGLTMGIFDDESGYPHIKRLRPEQAEKLNLKTRQMQWTFVEGGEMISGQFANGETYAIASSDVLQRTLYDYHQRFQKEISPDEGKELIAKDFQIKKENLFFVESYEHLDLNIMAIPGGKILINDPKLVPETIKNIISQQKLNFLEEKDLLGIKNYYENIYLLDAYQGRQLMRMLDKIEKDLESRFKIIRVAGKFLGPQYYTWGGARDRINFLNAFLGKNPQGNVFVFTNSAQGLHTLEKYWRKILNKFDIQDEHIYFDGNYSSGAGLDCLGAGSK